MRVLLAAAGECDDRDDDDECGVGGGRWCCATRAPRVHPTCIRLHVAPVSACLCRGCVSRYDGEYAAKEERENGQAAGRRNNKRISDAPAFHIPHTHTDSA